MTRYRAFACGLLLALSMAPCLGAEPPTSAQRLRDAIEADQPRAIALVVFVLQLAVNALWSWLFFAWQKGGWAFAEVLVFWVLIALTCAAFWRIQPLAGALLLPYLAWVGFAAYLNWVLWQANPVILG